MDDNYIQIVLFQISNSVKPIAVVASASLGVYVALHFWKMVRKAI